MMHRFRQRLTRSAIVAAISLGFVTAAAVVSSPANADTPLCKDSVTSAPTGAATVSA